MSIWSLLKNQNIDFGADRIIDPAEQISPEYGWQMDLLAAMHRQKVFTERMKAAENCLFEPEDFEFETSNNLDTNPATGLPMLSTTEDIGGHHWGSSCSDLLTDDW